MFFSTHTLAAKVGLIGLPKPFCDAVKLFAIEQTYPIVSSF